MTRDDLIREARRHIIDARHTLDSQSDAEASRAYTCRPSRSVLHGCKGDASHSRHSRDDSLL
jgi:hypothetical protein